MSTAFTLTVAYLAEHFSPARATGALAAYVTGNVASNLFGRIMSAAIADTSVRKTGLSRLRSARTLSAARTYRFLTLHASA